MYQPEIRLKSSPRALSSSLVVNGAKTRTASSVYNSNSLFVRAVDKLLSNTLNRNESGYHLVAHPG